MLRKISSALEGQDDPCCMIPHSWHECTYFRSSSAGQSKSKHNLTRGLLGSISRCAGFERLHESLVESLVTWVIENCQHQASAKFSHEVCNTTDPSPHDMNFTRARRDLNATPPNPVLGVLVSTVYVNVCKSVEQYNSLCRDFPATTSTRTCRNLATCNNYKNKPLCPTVFRP